ncbi:MAG TPA: hypothetical protein PKC91_08235 [Ignavibacteria bacterium]|nr:hypothetical protein [Ignavibacteria bacterium]
MSNNQKLIIIKVNHTLIWILFNVVLFYLAYSVIINKIDFTVYAGMCVIFIEGIVLMLFGSKCPLTVLARKYSDSANPNFDIYLPAWLAEYNKQIYTTFFIIILAGIIYRIIFS